MVHVRSPSNCHAQLQRIYRTQQTNTCSKSKLKPLEKGAKYVQN